MRKSIKKLLLIMAVIVTAVVCLTFSASAATEGNFTYYVTDGKAKVTDFPASYQGEVVIPSTLGGYPVTSIDSFAFNNCTRLTSITIPDSVTSIGYSAFRGCTSLTSITIPDGVTSIGSQAFYNCTGLTSINIPDSVKSIDSFAFEGCTSLTSITIPDSVTSIADYAFSDCTSLTSITIPDSVTSIGSSAFSDCTSLTSITIPDSVTSIGNYAFDGCTSLTSITIPDSVTSIGNYAFDDCTSLTSITLPFVGASQNGTSNTYFGYIFGASSYLNNNSYVPPSLKEVIITAPCKTIGSYAFYGCTSLTGITIPESVTSIGANLLSNCKQCIVHCYKNSYAASYAVSNSLFYILIDGTDEENTLSGKIGNLSWFFNKRTLTLKINGSVKMIDFTTIAAPWYEYRQYIHRLEISKGITYIGSSAFEGLDSLINITIPDSVTIIGNSAFCDCTGLTGITIPDSVTTIGNYAFRDCTSLTGITIPDSVTTIGHYAFAGCTGLTSITIPDSVTSIGDYAFRGCTGLTSITIPDSVTTIGSSAFSGCTGLTSITIPDSVTSIGVGAFEECTGLTSITIPDSVISIGYSAFYGCSALTSITFKLDENNHSGITTMPYISDTKVKDIILPASIKNIDNKVFPTDIKTVTVYNPDCTFASNCGLNYNSTIIGFKYSTAEKFAEQIGAEFIDVETIHSHSYKNLTDKNYCSFGRCTCGKEQIVKHTYSNACDNTCNKCSTTRTVPDHKWADATCTAPKTCSVCKVTSGKALGHKYSNACDKTCNRCSTTRTVPAHKWVAATCTAPKTCSVCKTTSGSALGHKWTAATCTKAKTCSVCKTTSGSALGHKYTTVTTKATLSKSGKVENKCSVCGYVSKTTTVYYPKTIKLSDTKYTYNGKTKTPTVTVKDTKGNTLKKDTDYTVKYASGRKNTGKYSVTITFKGKYSGTKKLYFNILPSKTSKITPDNTTASIKATWKKVTGADGYKVELLNSKGKVLKTATTTKLTYTFKKLSKVTTYKVRVTAYKTIDKKKVYATSSVTLTTSTAPAKVTLSKVTASSKAATPVWKTVSGASGYEVQYSTSKKMKKAKTATVKKGKTKKITIKKLTKGKTYYFRVRAYKTVDGKKVYGDWSATKSVKVK